jgi:hypothetical protein
VSPECSDTEDVAMKITVTSQNRKTITEHAGRCRKFWVFNTENDKRIDRALLLLTKEQ